jgi:CRP-like cAMP-binding protein
MNRIGTPSITGRGNGSLSIRTARITHAQLASAVGATRATVTRRLGALRRRGLLLSVGSGAGKRLCLRTEECR